MQSRSGSPAEGNGALTIDRESLFEAIREEFRLRPPTIGLIGLSGVGKSSTINAMFGTSLPVSATTRGTTRFIASDIEIKARELFGQSAQATLRVLDAPGLGEDVDLDKKYLDYYRRHLKKCDAVIWVLAGRNRALALDQRYLKTLRDRLPNLVLGVNQSDFIDPLDWNARTNMPSASQRENIATILTDRQERLARLFGQPVPVVAYSAVRYYGLYDLFNACIDQVSPNRRWMFEIIRKFSPDDWLERAAALSDEQRAKIKAQMGVNETRHALEQVVSEALGA